MCALPQFDHDGTDANASNGQVLTRCDGHFTSTRKQSTLTTTTKHHTLLYIFPQIFEATSATLHDGADAQPESKARGAV
jgi:hypothetical protein